MNDLDGRLDGERLFYRHWQHSDPPAHVVIAHGYGEHSGRYAHVAGRLCDAGYSAWALDHRGHGRSAGTRGDIESMTAAIGDLDVLIDRVADVAENRPIVLVGHSLGSAVAAAYAEEHQARLAGLALSAPVMIVPVEVLALGELEEIPELGLADGVSRDPVVVQAYKNDPLNYLGPPPRGFFPVMREVEKIRERLGVLTLPLLVMHGSGDLLVSPQGLREVVARVASEDLTARLWPGLFHEIFNEPERDDVLAFLVAWLDRLVG
jgi:acylglycerol lipase